MFLTRENYKEKLQEHALLNHHESVTELFEKYKRIKPNRMPYELICELIEGGGVEIDVCVGGDIIYNVDYANYGNTHSRIKQTLEKYGYWVASFTGNIFKDLDNGKYDAVGEIR